MPVISLISSKGGCGKTTISVLLATELARYGTVALVDTDPKQRAVKWHQKAPLDNPSIISCTDGKAFTRTLKELAANYDYVIVDTEGRESTINGIAIGRSDLVIIPTRDRQQDCEDTLEVIEEVIGIAEAYDREVPHRVLFNAVKPTARTKLQKALRGMISDQYETFETALVDRGPYDALFNQGGGLAQLDAKEFTNIPESTAEIFDLVEEILNVFAGDET